MKLEKSLQYYSALKKEDDKFVNHIYSINLVSLYTLFIFIMAEYLLVCLLSLFFKPTGLHL